MKQYTVQELANLSGVSVRTLHYYDQIGLLKPFQRSEGNYRIYGEQELIRLQQILFYRELSLPLKQIQQLLNDPAFDSLQSLEEHKRTLALKKAQLNELLTTIDKTILHLKKENEMKNPEELYAGFGKTKAKAYREEAQRNFGTETVQHAERELMKLGKQGFEHLNAEFNTTWQNLFQLRHDDPSSIKAQVLIDQHYQLTRKFWGTSNKADPQAEAYKGLGEMYVADERFVNINGEVHPEFATFLNEAINYYVKTKFNR